MIARRLLAAVMAPCLLWLAHCTSAPVGRPHVKPDAQPHAQPDVNTSPAAGGAAALEPGQWTQLSPSIRIDRAAARVEFIATAVISEGFLEQYVCAVGTREHESLFAFDGKASELHAALLLAGCTPGTPGYWRQVERSPEVFALESTPPTGDELECSVRLPDGLVHPLPFFVRASPVAEHAAGATPPSRFVFAGSRFRTDTRTGREVYLADGSGSIIGLVSFGDELIGALEVISDQAELAPPVWEVHSERMPTPGTTVTILLQRCRAAE